MTKSTTPKDKNLKKPTPKRRSGTGGGSPASDSGFQTADSDRFCLINFRAELKLNDIQELAIGSELTFLANPSGASEVIVIRNGHNYGSYSGENTATMLACMKLGYIYRARITRLSAESATVEVRGEGA